MQWMIDDTHFINSLLVRTGNACVKKITRNLWPIFSYPVDNNAAFSSLRFETYGFTRIFIYNWYCDSVIVRI
jgi:hypothetical protein